MGRSIVRVAIRRGLGRAESPQCARRRNPQPPVGIDAPTPARVVGLPPRGGQYFLSKRKKVPKKACGTATPEAARPAARRGLRPAGALRAVLCLGSLCSPAGKKPLIAHFDGGARNVARNGIGQLSPALGARSCSPFSAVKMGGPFSLRCLSPLCSPAGGVEHTQMAVLGMCLCCLDGFAAQENRLDFSSVIGASHTQIVPLGIIPHRNLDIFVTQKASVGSNPRWPFLRAGGPVARRRSVLFNEQGIHTRPVSREARCRAAVKPRTS